MIRRLIPVFILLFSFNFTEVKAQVPLPARNLQVDSLTLLATWDPPKSTLLEEGFEGDSLPANWSRSSMGQGWDTATVGVMGLIPIPEHGRYMLTNDGEADPGNNGCCDYLITPILDLTGYGNYQLSFRSFFTGNYGQLAYVKMSSDNGLNWATLMQLAPNPAWQEITVDLSMYSGPGGLSNVMFSFHADDQGQEASGWAVDDVMVFSDSLGVTGYTISVDSVAVGNTASTSYQLDPMMYLPVSGHTCCVSAVYGYGSSQEVCKDYLCFYLPPPQNLSNTVVGDSIIFTWDIPLTQAQLLNFILYPENGSFIQIPASDTSYSVYCENGEVCIRMTSVYDVTLYGFPGLASESDFAVSCGYSDSGYDLPVAEDWSSGQFALNGWEAGPGWEIDNLTGQDAPSVMFSAPPGKGAYASSLGSWYYDATAITECSPVDVNLDFDIRLDDPVSPCNDVLQIHVLTGDEDYTLPLNYPTCSSFWLPVHYRITDLVKGTNFRVRFEFLGPVPGDSAVWHIDNIHVYYTSSGYPEPFFIDANRTGSPENDVLVSWNNYGSGYTEYILDDGSSEQQLSVGTPVNIWLGNEFPVTESGSIVMASVYLLETPGAFADYTIDVFDGSRNLVASSLPFVAHFGDWTHIFLPEIPFTGPFYCMLHIRSNVPPDQPGIDSNGPNAAANYAWAKVDSDWYKLNDLGYDPGVCMLRVSAIVDGEMTTFMSDSHEKLSTSYTNQKSPATPGAMQYSPLPTQSITSECDTLGYGIYRRAYNSYPPGGNGMGGEWEWIGCTPANVRQYLDKNLGNDLYNCYEYAISVIYPVGESLPAGNAWDCIYVGQPELQDDPDVKLYPNPADDYVSINLNNDFIKGLLLDIHGKRLSEFSLEGKTIETIFTGTYPDGIYLFGLQKVDGSFVSGKLVVRH